MSPINTKISEIDPSEYYSASEIVKQKWLWMKTVLTLTAFLRSEEGSRLLKPIISKKGRVVRYRIRGAELINMLEMIDRGELTIKNEPA